jgi:hypothetical protein
MKKILLVSGCSWTDKNFSSIFHPDMDCSWPKWPELLAKKLNMECINLGFGGSGQEYIYNSILDYSLKIKKENIGLIIPAWSNAARRDYQWDKRWTNIRWDTKGDMHYYIRRSLRYYYSFQIFCERYDLPYKQIQMLSLFTDPVPETKDMDRVNYFSSLKTMVMSDYFVENIDYKEFIGWPVFKEINGFCMRDKLDQETHFISEEDRHPNAEGQKVIAETIYNNLINDTK